MMIIKKLKLVNFRTYQNIDFKFDDGLNIIEGKNAQGKTNMLEALYFCCIGKSFRTNKDRELITWQKNISKIEIDIQRKYRTSKIEIIVPSVKKKTIKIDGIPIKRIGELLGELNIVFFSPDELRLIKDSPNERRRFMDIDISQSNKNYFYLLGRYEKILDNRNKLLKTSKTIEIVKETIFIWDKQLVDAAKKIIFTRREFVQKLSPFANLACMYLTNNEESLKLNYLGEDGETLEKIEKNLLFKLKKNLEKDFKLGYTSIGPHRDEIEVFINDIEVKTFGSQGQQRTAALSMKLAELQILEEQTGEKPILLLDDVFSELDASRRAKLLNFSQKTQTFITCTEFKNSIKHRKFVIKKIE